MKDEIMLNASRILIAGVWIFHGLYSKILNGIPRHRLIVGKILGDEWERSAVLAVGIAEVLLGAWVLSRRRPRACAATQTMAIVAMNTLEILYARDLLISALGMVMLNAVFLTIAWWVALRSIQRGSHPA